LSILAKVSHVAYYYDVPRGSQLFSISWCDSRVVWSYRRSCRSCRIWNVCFEIAIFAIAMFKSWRSVERTREDLFVRYNFLTNNSVGDNFMRDLIFQRFGNSRSKQASVFVNYRHLSFSSFVSDTILACNFILNEFYSFCFNADKSLNLTAKLLCIFSVANKNGIRVFFSSWRKYEPRRNKKEGKSISKIIYKSFLASQPFDWIWYTEAKWRMKWSQRW